MPSASADRSTCSGRPSLTWRTIEMSARRSVVSTCHGEAPVTTHAHWIHPVRTGRTVLRGIAWAGVRAAPVSVTPPRGGGGGGGPPPKRASCPGPLLWPSPRAGADATPEVAASVTGTTRPTATRWIRFVVISSFPRRTERRPPSRTAPSGSAQLTEASRSPRSGRTTGFRGQDGHSAPCRRSRRTGRSRARPSRCRCRCCPSPVAIPVDSDVDPLVPFTNREGS